MLLKNFALRFCQALSGSGSLILLALAVIIYLAFSIYPLDFWPTGLDSYKAGLGSLLVPSFGEFSFIASSGALMATFGYASSFSGESGFSLKSVRPLYSNIFTIFVLFLFSSILVDGMYYSEEIKFVMADPMRYLILTDRFQEAILSGNMYPRWLPDLFFGYGYPTFLFYPPGYFYFSSILFILSDWISLVYPVNEDVLSVTSFGLTIVLVIGGYGHTFYAGT
ncbi:MAG: hypothetical protein OEZ04_06900 [Nitrospinota bacterium]|nr:hypothetical protein [Nitrospinota bacterium]